MPVEHVLKGIVKIFLLKCLSQKRKKSGMLQGLSEKKEARPAFTTKEKKKDRLEYQYRRGPKIAGKFAPWTKHIRQGAQHHS